jgi:dCMP deaminase
MKTPMQNSRPNWDEYFFAIAEVASKRSQDPNSQVGAVIVNDDHVLLSTGYNGPARGVMDLPERILENQKEKLRWMCHAEANAVFNAAKVGTQLDGATIYVTKFPCVACAGAIAQVGIKRVYTEGDFWRNDPNGDDGGRAYQVLAESGVKIHAPNLSGAVRFADNGLEARGQEHHVDTNSNKSVPKRTGGQV